MKQEWSDEELIEHWTLESSDYSFLANKTGVTRLGCAVLLKFFQLEAKFPVAPEEVSAVPIAFLAKQLKIPARSWIEYDWQSRSITYHRQQIRERFGFREFTVLDKEAAANWLVSEILPHETNEEHVLLRLRGYFRTWKIEPPTEEQISRLFATAQARFEEAFANEIYNRLSPKTFEKLMQLLEKSISVFDENSNPDLPDAVAIEKADPNSVAAIPGLSLLAWLREDPGKLNLETVRDELKKLSILRDLQLPTDLFDGYSTKVITLFRRRLMTEILPETRRRAPASKAALLAAFCFEREQETIDHLVELLLHLIHRIAASAEKTVIKQIVSEVKRVAGKQSILLRLAETAVANPEGIIKNTLFPVVGEQTLKDLIREFKAQGESFREQVYTRMLASYSHYYRRLATSILQDLEFCSNNEQHQPVIEAIEIIRRYAVNKAQFFPLDENIPIEDVVKGVWEPHILAEDERGRTRIDRRRYEIAVLQTLRDRLRCKEIWVAGANRYRDPDEDLPADFEDKRQSYYLELKQPLSGREFVEKLRIKMWAELSALNYWLPGDAEVRIINAKGAGRISLSPLEAQADPVNLHRIKKTIATRWAMTSLLDVLKETDLRTSFTAEFKSPMRRENLSKSVLQRRLLLVDLWSRDKYRPQTH